MSWKWLQDMRLDNKKTLKSLYLQAITLSLLKKQKRQWLISESLTPLEAGEEGFEPPLTVLETVALPLNYSPSLLTQL